MNNSTNKTNSDFNPEQQAAIDADCRHNVLISAGAGSGKTKTLTERVFRLIESGDVKPSQLLVLTFTNNAAHEMKERIVARFRKSNSPLAEEMQSAHVQTFDSFSQYLVSTYAGRLGISNKISVANESSMNAKKEEILDSVFQRYYDNPELRQRLLKTLVKFNTNSDRNLRKIVKDIDRQLEKMLPSERRDFIEHYDERFFTKEFVDECLDAYLEENRRWIIDALYKSYFLETYYDAIEAAQGDAERLKPIFSYKEFFTRDYKSFHFADEAYCEPLYRAILELLDKKGQDFVQAVKDFSNRQKEYLERFKEKSVKEKHPEFDKDAIKKVKAVWQPMRGLFATKEAVLVDLQHLGTGEENIELFFSFKDDIHLLLKMVEEMDNALFDFKKSINTFTFSDISTMALRLVIEPEFQDIARQIRKRFKYIMVDEYQDTNDYQEAFINSLLEPDEDGNRAHLFCVGDAKQSIYAFRNSNVELFRARQAQYECNGVDQVIHMNRNYRSGEQLLKEINYIFSYYMTEKHGSIDYQDEKEQLKYDKDVDIYGEPYSGFGIYRIIQDCASAGENSVVWEAHAAIQLIKEMVNPDHPHFVYDRSAKEEKIRPCQYRDFAILTRKKSGFALYQKLFSEAGIPLNISITTNLCDIDAIILLQSIVSLIAWKKFGVEADVKHLFASVARSYAYQYSDEDIYSLISYKAPDGVDEDDPQRDLAMILKDPIMVKLEEFCKAHWNSSFNTIFLNLLSSFQIIEKLYLIGNVEDNIAKIESLHQMVLAEEKAGEGLPDFVRLIRSIRKYELDLKTDSDYETENSVDLMTIHASKGLERKIIILPASLNALGKENALAKPDYDFSKDFGILLPNYVLPGYRESCEEGVENQKITPVHSVPYALYNLRKKSRNPDIDEHVRLFYVALTRAENAIYIIGDDPKTEGSLYEMLKTIPHFVAFNDELVEKKIKSSPERQRLYDQYLKLVRITQNEPLPLTSKDLTSDQYRIYQDIARDYYQSKTQAELDDAITKIQCSLYCDYLNDAKAKYAGNLDFYARLYGAWKCPEAGVKSFADYLEYYYNLFKQEDAEATDEPEIDDGQGRDAVPDLLIADSDDSNQGSSSCEANNSAEDNFDLPTPDEIEQLIREFGEAALNQNYVYFGKKEIKQKKNEDISPEIHSIMSSVLLDAYAMVSDGFAYVCRVSYASALYPDRTSEFHWKQEEDEIIVPTPKLVDLNIEQINNQTFDFEIRGKKRASKMRPLDDDTPIQDLLDRGLRLHRLMELVDWETRDLSFIPEMEDRKLVQDVLNLPLLRGRDGSRFLPEYGYYDEELKTPGFIDLLIIQDGVYTIVDWKTKDVDDLAYAGQLHTYQRNVQRLFGVPKSRVRLVLVSLLERRVREIAVE